jgi:hypothetical protein
MVVVNLGLEFGTQKMLSTNSLTTESVRPSPQATFHEEFVPVLRTASFKYFPRSGTGYVNIAWHAKSGTNMNLLFGPLYVRNCMYVCMYST